MAADKLPERKQPGRDVLCSTAKIDMCVINLKVEYAIFKDVLESLVRFKEKAEEEGYIIQFGTHTDMIMRNWERVRDELLRVWKPIYEGRGRDAS